MVTNKERIKNNKINYRPTVFNHIADRYTDQEKAYVSHTKQLKYNWMAFCKVIHTNPSINILFVCVRVSDRARVYTVVLICMQIIETAMIQ